jgi:hypothetical protein
VLSRELILHTLIHTFAFQRCPLYLWVIHIPYSFPKQHCGASAPLFFGTEFALGEQVRPAKYSMKRLGGVAKMKLTCIQCEKSFSFGDSVEVLYCDEGIYFFCNEYCRDNWASEVALLSESEDLQQSSA